MEKAFIRPLIIHTKSGDDVRYAEEKEGISMTELDPLTGGIHKGSLDAKVAISNRSTNLYVKGPTRGSPDIKYIEEDESESELTALSGIHSRESSTAPAGDCFVEYDVEELNKLLIATPGSSTNTGKLPSDNHAETKSEEARKKKDSVVTIVDPSEENRVIHKTDRLKVPAHSDSATEHTYSSILKDDFSPFRLLSRQPSLKSRSSSPGEGGRRLHSSASAEGRDEEEISLEVLRQVVRKCTNADPRKRPCSTDVLELLASQIEKS